MAGSFLIVMLHPRFPIISFFQEKFREFSPDVERFPYEFGFAEEGFKILNCSSNILDQPEFRLHLINHSLCLLHQLHSFLWISWSLPIAAMTIECFQTAEFCARRTRSCNVNPYLPPVTPIEIVNVLMDEPVGIPYIDYVKPEAFESFSVEPDAPSSHPAEQV